jgi:uncharacterized protein YjiS (DUF1127 family)
MPAAVSSAMINCQAVRAAPVPRATALLRTVAETLTLWLERVKSRRAFPALSERELSDLGLSRWDFEHELRKPFWRD